VKHIANQH